MNRAWILLALVGGLAVAAWALRSASADAPAAEAPVAEPDRIGRAVARAADLTDAEAAEREPVAVDARKEHAWIRGRVEWPDGVAVAGATVRCAEQDRFRPVATTPRGEFQVRVASPFEGSLVAELGSLRSPPVAVAATADEAPRVVLRFGSMPSLRGVLVDPQGRGTRGFVTVAAADGRALEGLGPRAGGRAIDSVGAPSREGVRYRLHADEHGLFRGVVEPGVQLRIVGEASGHGRSDLMTVDVPVGGVDVTVPLVELLDLLGEVVRPDGTPWVGCELWALDRREALPADDYERAPRASTDGEGKFLLGGVPGTRSITVMVARDDAAQVHVLREIDPRVEPLRIVIDDAELAAASLRIEAFGADGARLERFMALAYRRGEDARMWPTGAGSTEDGVVRIEGFPPGVEIGVAVKTGQRTLAVQRCVCTAGENAITLRVEPPGALEVRAEGALRVDLMGPDGVPDVSWHRVRDGVARWPSLVPGEYRLGADFGEGDQREATATVLPGRTATVDLGAKRR